VVSRLAGKVPILGVCLGHQALGQHFGGRIHRAPRPVHGKASTIRHDGRGVFRDLPSPFQAARYHSLAVDAASLPRCLMATAWAEDGVVMGIRHRSLAVEGIQFHPESILSEHGLALLATWLLSLPDEPSKAAGQARAG
jgi:anthranilate synthase component 2